MEHQAPPTAEPDPMLSRREVERETGWSESTVLRRVAEGKLHPVRSHPGRGGRFFFRRAEVEALLAELAAATRSGGPA